MRDIVAFASCMVLAACASPHVQPGAMTASEHERAASGHLGRAREADGKYDPEDRPGLPCLLLGMHGGDACFGKMHNETAEHHEAAELERRRAAEHVAAADALRDEELRACAGSTELEATDGPLTGSRFAFTAQPLIDYDDQVTVFGVVMTFAAGDANADRLQSLVECHRAQVASRGPAMNHACPLDDGRLDVMVIAAPHGVLLQLRSADPNVARQAWEGARDAARDSRPPPSKVRAGVGGS